jgi:hypothetical protein
MCNTTRNFYFFSSFLEAASFAAASPLGGSPDHVLESFSDSPKPRLAEAQEAGIPIYTGTLTRIAMKTAEQWSTSMTFQEKKLLKAQLRENWL